MNSLVEIKTTDERRNRDIGTALYDCRNLSEGLSVGERVRVIGFDNQRELEEFGKNMAEELASFKRNYTVEVNNTL